jgi:UDP-N-acetylmuramoylalanine--D-glutamate ligase
MNEFRNKNISVIGAARSGLASAMALQKLGAVPFLSEFKSADKYPDAASRLNTLGIECEFGGHSDKVYDCEMIVTSPGVPSSSEVLKKAAARGIKIISELELGFQLCRGKVIAITGSNGKTTTTSLIGEIFKHSDKRGSVAGNIGQPFAGIVDDIKSDDWAILEVSTFQLEWIDKFKPQVATVLNITPDHLDRHGTMENYINLKLRVFANQNGTNKSVVNSDDEILRAYNSNSETWGFSTKHEVDLGCFIDGDIMKLRITGKDAEVIHIDEIGIKGPHNLSNACAAAACCAAAGISITAIADGLRSFKGVEHRLEKVGLIGGVSFINDSKATNVDAVYWALQSVSPPIVLIAGGRDKNGDFSTLRDLIKERVKAAILIGEAASKMAAAWDGITEIVHAGSMEEAIKKAYAKARPEGSVLLSPACASYDMFDNYEHRGQVFKQVVNALIGEQR